MRVVQAGQDGGLSLKFSQALGQGVGWGVATGLMGVSRFFVILIFCITSLMRRTTSYE